MTFLMLLPLSSSGSTAGEALNHKLDYSLTNEQSTSRTKPYTDVIIGHDGELRERHTVKLVRQLTEGLWLPAAQGGEPLVEVGSFAEVVVLPVACPHDSDEEGDAKHRPPHGQLLVATTTREQIQHDLTRLPIIVASR